MTILVVDDAMFMRKMLVDIFAKYGHTIVGEASNGKEAFEIYKATKPDLVTMDITMPEVNGIKGLELIMGYDKDATVVMCSAMGQQAMVVEAIQKGAKDFIVKPFDPMRVASMIEKFDKKNR